MKETTNQDDTSRTSIFLSYSRTDRSHAERIADELRSRGYQVSRDLDDILPTEEWRGRLGELIVNADVIVFLLSPKSASSEMCQWEVELAQSFNKKIAPIVVEDIAGAQIPQMLSRLNYIFATERDRFENAVNSLCDAIGTDIEWLREHTRLTRVALDYEKNGRQRSNLLSHTALNDAERWLATRPTSVNSVSLTVIRYMEASRIYQEIRARYAEAKLKALTLLVEPMLTTEVESLKARADQLDRNWSGSFVRTDAEGSEQRDKIKTIENFHSGRGRWHPQPAEYLKNAGATADYLEVYRFPCCGKHATLKDCGEPFQFRADGCENDPSI
jgi:hypothetical protein